MTTTLAQLLAKLADKDVTFYFDFANTTFINTDSFDISEDEVTFSLSEWDDETYSLATEITIDELGNGSFIDTNGKEVGITIYAKLDINSLL